MSKESLRRRKENKDKYFLIDASGSMSGARLEAAKRTIKDLFDKLAAERPYDRIAIMSFSDRVAFRCHPHPVQKIARKREMPEILSSIYAGGGTALYNAIYEAISQLRDKTIEVNMIVLTDGEDNMSDHTMADITALLAFNPQVTLDIIHVDTVAPAPVAEYQLLTAAGAGEYSRVTDKEIEITMKVVFQRRL